MKVSILLSTYNGESFLAEQLDSIISQTYSDWKLYIRDDGSKDNTLKIIASYCDLFPDKICLFSDGMGNLKSALSFMHMLSVVESDYYMFCDQDDVWLPFKIEKTFAKMKKLEDSNRDKSILVFTNLSIVDIELNFISSSMWNYSSINPENAKNFYKTTCNSSVTGCTIMMNKSLKQQVLPYPKVALMHDWWISLNASHYGVVDYISEPTILYRQHGNNVLGANLRSKNHYLKKLLVIKETINSNLKVLVMLKELRFNVNYFKFFAQKLKVILIK